jgi:hypothetical protein
MERRKCEEKGSQWNTKNSNPPKRIPTEHPKL